MRKAFAMRRPMPGAAWWVKQLQAAAEAAAGARVHRCRECGGRIRLGEMCRVCHVEQKVKETI
jgi:hypothetical protein